MIPGLFWPCCLYMAFGKRFCVLSRFVYELTQPKNGDSDISHCVTTFERSNGDIT
jgi:hypothetical protein